jgi:hypothetical protein
MSTPWGVELDDLALLVGFSDLRGVTNGGIIGLGNQTVIILAINLDDWRGLGIETSLNR